MDLAKSGWHTALGLLLLSTLAFLVTGYHPGIEDDCVYLTAIKADLNPQLYPHDSDFFRIQLQATVYDKALADTIRWSHIPVAWMAVGLQFLCILVILWGCRRIAERLFAEEPARWAGVAMVAAMLTLPAAGTALTLVDQYLHARTIATALILLAVDQVLRSRRLLTATLLAAAFVVHPIMGAMGISFCCILSVCLSDTATVWVEKRRESLAAVAAMPLGWIFEPPTPVWRAALDTRNYYFLSRWQWYEWLGVIGPIILFWILSRAKRRSGESQLARFSVAVVAYSLFQLAVAIVMLTPPALIRLTPLQPMRFLHLDYFFLALVGGALLGRHILGRHIWRWALFLVVANVGMFIPQRVMFQGSEHLELPGQRSANPWMQAFEWVRGNTPTDAYFAMDPHYMVAPEENYHSFRALAERSQLADAVKDTAVVTQVPQLGPVWWRQVHAVDGWSHFQLADFERLKAQFGVDWALVSYPAAAGLDCRWHNDALAVCRIP